jgi:hypothetical protein
MYLMKSILDSSVCLNMLVVEAGTKNAQITIS